MAKRKVDAENRGFQARWEAEYMFTEVNGKPVCLVHVQNRGFQARWEAEYMFKMVNGSAALGL